jgi:hypothetical protein
MGVGAVIAETLRRSSNGGGRCHRKQEMMEVTGDTITVPVRFWSGGQLLAS